MIIPYCEICEILRDSYIDDGKNLVPKHSLFNGEREFAIALIEQCMGLLSRDVINDRFIVQYLQGLLAFTNPENKYYENFLIAFSPESSLISKCLGGENLSNGDIAIIKELMQSNMAEYTMKGEYQRCCYSAMLAFFQTAYCILTKRVNFFIKHIDMIADLDDQLESIQLYESSEPVDAIIVDWHSSNRINSIYMLYKNRYSGLDKDSILDLVAADVIEEDYYFKDERFSIAPSILTKQYCSIIEHEINKIIQLLNLPNKPKKHLMWAKMKKYVKSNNIDLTTTDFSLSDVLEDLYSIRNNGSHGDAITKDEYKTITKYKNLGLFDGISMEKLRLKNGKISPTIDELNDYMG